MAKIVVNFTATVGCVPCLVLPFSTVSEHLISDSVYVQGPNRKEYSVKVVKQENNIFLVDGWTDVEEENSLNQGDILFFKLFEGSKLCFTILESMMMQNMGSEGKVNVENMMIQSMGSGEKVDLSYEKKNTDGQHVKKKSVRFQEPKRRLRFETGELQDVREKKKQRARSEEDDLQDVREKKKKRARSEEEVNLAMTKTKATDDKRDDKRAEDIKAEIEAGQKRLSNPNAIIKFTRAKVKYPTCPLPRPFASKVQAENGSIVNVIVPGCKSKLIKWVSFPTYKGFGGGWSKFRKVHKIQEGDWALLELTIQNTIIIHMHRRSRKGPSSSTPLLSSWSSSTSDEEDEEDLSEEPENSSQEPRNSDLSSSSNSGPSSSSSDKQKICRGSSVEACNDKVLKQSLRSPKRETRSSFKWKLQEYSKMLKNPFVYVEMTKSRLGDKCLIQKSFIHKNLGDLKKGENVIFECIDDCTHELGWTCTGGLSKGWPEFTSDHHLKEGDVLLLELLDPRIFKVHLFRI